MKEKKKPLKIDFNTTSKKSTLKNAQHIELSISYVYFSPLFRFHTAAGNPLDPIEKNFETRNKIKILWLQVFSTTNIIRLTQDHFDNKNHQI